MVYTVSVKNLHRWDNVDVLTLKEEETIRF